MPHDIFDKERLPSDIDTFLREKYRGVVGMIKYALNKVA